jgi:hypothetical protein
MQLNKKKKKKKKKKKPNIDPAHVICGSYLVLRITIPLIHGGNASPHSIKPQKYIIINTYLGTWRV